ncbi:ATPase [uncultured Ilyobacter sp.]|uniref:ATPase n=1 Tax=uncultured Ilyobacter sp. TaxID=544433 RepID=UPI0029C6B4A6|nr:ATPase [uncultured Ilyobacter sp.]
MFGDIISNEEAKSFLKNEIKIGKKSGTYLFYGERGSELMEFSLAFAKGLNCSEDPVDFCGKCDVCLRIDSGNYPDVEVVEDPTGIKINQVREVIYKASSSSYEGRKKVFILKDIENLRVEAANALLKIIEEPGEGTFFIMTSHSLNIIPTIISRSTAVHIKKKNPEELGITEEEYEFFFGDVAEIEMYKKIGIDLHHPVSYSDIGEHIKNYVKDGEIESRINIKKSLRDFMGNRRFLDDIEKIYFAEEIYRGSRDRSVAESIMYEGILLNDDLSKTEGLLHIKGMLRFPVNVQLALKMFFLKI